MNGKIVWRYSEKQEKNESRILLSADGSADRRLISQLRKAVDVSTHFKETTIQTDK